MDGSAPWRQTSSDWRTAGNFALGGAGSGLAFCAALLSLATSRQETLAFVLAPLLIGGGLALVWAELGPPVRLLQDFFAPNASWLKRGAVIAPVLALASWISAVFPVTPLLLLVMLLAGGFVYTQARILKDSDAVPAWRDRRLVPLLLQTGVVEGAGLLAVLATVTFSSGTPTALRLAIAMVALRWPFWSIYRDGLAEPETAKATEGTRLLFAEPRVAIVLWTPCALLALAALLPVFGGVAAVLGGLATTASGWWLKYLILTQGPFNQTTGQTTGAAPATAGAARTAPPA